MISPAFLLVSLPAAFEARSPAPASEGSGGPSVAWAGPTDPTEGNPALEARTDGRFKAGAASSRPMGLEGLSSSLFWVGARTGPSLGLELDYRNLSAGDVYREDQGAGDLSWSGGRFGGGLGMRWSRVEFLGEQQGVLWGWSGGILAAPVQCASFGASFEDLSAFQSDGIPTPWRIRAGLAGFADDSSWIGLFDAQYLQRRSWTFRLGQEWRAGVLRLRSGFRLAPWSLSLGTGVVWHGVALDWAWEGEPELGFQTRAGVAWGL